MPWTAVEVRAWMSNHILLSYTDEIINACPKLDAGLGNLTHLPLNKMDAILADDIFKCILLNENVRISIKISLKFVPKGPIGWPDNGLKL